MALQRAKAPYDRLLLLLVVAFALAADTAGGAPAGNIARKGAPARPRSHHRSSSDRGRSGAPVSLYEAASYCLSWRLAVEADNVKEWRTAPSQCWPHIQIYMLGGQYGTDLNFIMQHIVDYVDGIVMAGDGFDAWVLDVDDTCLSNLLYYSHRRFGCDPYDPEGFRSWASRGESPAIPAVLRLFNKLVDAGFHVMLLTGRDEQMLGQATTYNLHKQGFVGYDRLIMRSAAQRGESAVKYKSEARKELTEQGYRIWGNVGDQWSDLQGDCPGTMTFKLPNPMYFVP